MASRPQAQGSKLGWAGTQCTQIHWEPGALSPYNKPDKRKGESHLHICRDVTVLARPSPRQEEGDRSLKASTEGDRCSATSWTQTCPPPPPTFSLPQALFKSNLGLSPGLHL